jgi:hypothetical protein
MNDIFQQIKRLQTDIRERQKAVDELQAEVRELERELDAFSTRYDKVLHALNRLDAVKKAISELEHERRIRALGQQGAPLRQRPWKPPAGYVPVEEQIKRNQQNRRNPTTDPEHDLRESAQETPEAAKTSDEINLEAEVKRLYRKLARRWHPDLATDEADAKHRTQMMALINEAYAAQDLETLLSLDDDLNNDSGNAQVTPLVMLRLRQLQKSFRDLTQRLTALRQEHFDLMHNSLMDMKIEESLAAGQGRDLLGEIIAEADAEYWQCMARLDELQREA